VRTMKARSATAISRWRWCSPMRPATRANVAEYDYRPAGEDGGDADDALFDAWRGREGRERDVLFGERTGRLW
jgi:hypothetical protein